MAALNGCDAIVFSAGIGENSPAIRAQVCQGLDGLGVQIDDERNNRTIDSEQRISAASNDIQVWVIPTNDSWLFLKTR